MSHVLRATDNCNTISTVQDTVCGVVKGKKVKVKVRIALHGEIHDRATERHLPYGITQCYLPPDTGERARLNPSHARRYSIYLPGRDGRLS